MSLGDADPGLQRERTALAWRRTGLTAFALGLLLVRLGIVHDNPAEVAAGTAALLTATVVGAVGSRAVLRDHQRRRRLTSWCAACMATLSTATLVTVLVA